MKLVRLGWVDEMKLHEDFILIFSGPVKAKLLCEIGMYDLFTYTANMIRIQPKAAKCINILLLMIAHK